MGRRLLARLPSLAAVVAAGLLMCASFAPLAWWWSAMLSFAVLAAVLTRPSTTYWGGFGYGFVFGLAFYVPLLPWISGFVGLVPWLALSVMCALFPALFGLLAVAVRSLPGWPLWFAFVWVAQEWLKCSVPFGGFPWGVVGFSQTTGPLLPLAQLGGVPLLSLGVALVGFGLAAIALETVARWRGHRDAHVELPRSSAVRSSPHRRLGDTELPRSSAVRSSPHRRLGDTEPPAVVLPGVLIAVVLLTTTLVHPHVRQSGAGAGNEPTVTVAAVQGNVPRLGLEFNAQRRAVLDNHVNETIRLADEVHAGRAAQPQFVIWPENSSDIDPLANADARTQIDSAVQAINAPILVGGVVATPDWTPERPAATNTVIVWNPQTGPGERHDKQIVQPFGEYLPWRGFFRHLSSWADRAGYFVPGSGTGVVHAAGVPIGVTTCWEVIFDRAARESVRNGAQVLTVPTNNATFNQTMSEQQLAFARARAVEHDRYVVVAGTTGISAVIAPDGRELARTKFFEPAFLDAQIRLKTAQTPATRWGPQIQWVLVGIGFAAVLAGIMHNGGFMRRRRHQPMTDSTGGTMSTIEEH